MISLLTLYDTGAALNTGYLPYHLAIAKKYPHLVNSITQAEDKYESIVLSGIVKENEAQKQQKNMTVLPTVIEQKFHHPTKTGGQMFIKFVLGNDVAVNDVVGNVTLKAAKMHMDVDTDMVDTRVMDKDPYGIPLEKGDTD